MNKLLLVVCLCAVPFSAMAELKLEGDPDDLQEFLHPRGNVVRIYGESEQKAYADKAIASLLLTTEDALLSRAIAANSDLRKRVADTLTASGISADAIQSSKFSTSPQYGWFGGEPASYQVVNRMAVGIVKESHLKEIATVADTHKEVELSGLSFEHTQKDAFNHQVKMDALNDIMRQKEFYERTLGVTLTPVRFGEGDTRLHPTDGARMRFQAVSMSMAVDDVREDRDRNASRSPSHSAGDAPASSFDEIHYEAALSVDFTIEESTPAPPCASEC